MFPTVCQIGPISPYTYGITVAIITAAGLLALNVVRLSGGIERRAIMVVLFWVLALAILAMIPLVTSITVYSYGLMLAVAVAVSTLLLAGEARRKNIKADIIFDLVFWMVIGGIIGARLFYVVLNFPFFKKYPNEILMIQNGGLAWQGGLILGFVAFVLYVNAKKLSLSQMLDLSAPYLALGQSIGRIGCFLNGCCFGKGAAWGVYFPVHDAYLHPTQLYLTAGYLVIFIILRRYQKFSEIPGLVFVSYLILASSLRFGVEFFRADHEILFLGLSIYQFVSFGVLLFAFFLGFYLLVKNSNPYET